MSETDPFRIRTHVPEFELISDGYRRASDAARARWRARIDVAYGPGSEDRLDLFFPDGKDGKRPIHIFIHGGYWRANVKEDYAFMANTICATGAIAAIVEYSHMPIVRMATLVDQVRRAARWLGENATLFNGDPTAITASGHSAGAHLAFYLIARGPAEAALPQTFARSLFLVSGIYDLQPIRSSFLQPEILLHAEEADDWSPLKSAIATDTPTSIVVGANETTPFINQAHSLAEIVSPNAPLIVVEDADHMSIVRDMGDMASPMGSIFINFLRTGSIR